MGFQLARPCSQAFCCLSVMPPPHAFTVTILSSFTYPACMCMCIRIYVSRTLSRNNSFDPTQVVTDCKTQSHECLTAVWTCRLFKVLLVRFSTHQGKVCGSPGLRSAKSCSFHCWSCLCCGCLGPSNNKFSSIEGKIAVGTDTDLCWASSTLQHFVAFVQVIGIASA